MLKRWISVLLIFVLILCGVAGCSEEKETKPKKEKPVETVPEEPAKSILGEEVVSFALFGVDTLNKSMKSRSDTIIIVSLDPSMKEIRLSAIMRDSYVTIDHPKWGKYKDKLNHAYAYGGGELAVKTLNENFGLNIKDYATINFTNLEKLVDALGGLEMEVSKNYRSEANHHISALAGQRGISPKLIKNTGKQHLNGMQVLGMLRCRKQVGGVKVRSETNEIFLEACFEKLKTKDAAEFPALAKTLIDLIQTTLSKDYIIEVALELMSEDYKIRREVFPLEEDLKGYGDRMIKGVYYTTFNEKTTPAHLQDFILKGKLPEKK